MIRIVLPCSLKIFILNKMDLSRPILVQVAPPYDPFHFLRPLLSDMRSVYLSWQLRSVNQRVTASGGVSLFLFISSASLPTHIPWAGGARLILPIFPTTPPRNSIPTFSFFPSFLFSSGIATHCEKKLGFWTFRGGSA